LERRVAVEPSAISPQSAASGGPCLVASVYRLSLLSDSTARTWCLLTVAASSMRTAMDVE
jgi:hypothetical protein